MQQKNKNNNIDHVQILLIMYRSTLTMYMSLLDDVQDIERKYGFLECKYRAILHGSTTDCTTASARGQATVKRGRISGGKLILFLIYLSYNK